MPKVKVYTADYCPYCKKAKNLLDAENIEYEEVNLEGQPEKLQELKERTKMRTIPQIFINDELIGGFSELNALHQSKKLKEKIDA